MRLLDDLRGEHERIEAVLGSLQAYVQARADAGAGAEDAAAYLAFFRLYAGRYHHAREEEILFAALVAESGLPADRGPIAAFVRQHHEMAAQLDELAELLVRPALAAAEGDTLIASATAYAHALLRHIDAENSVLLPESEARLRRAGILELPDRPLEADEREARDAAEALLRRHPPRHDATALRGEGCVVCPSFGVSCDGVEREWWGDDEWDDFFDRVG